MSAVTVFQRLTDRGVIQRQRQHAIEPLRYSLSVKSQNKLVHELDDREPSE